MRSWVLVVVVACVAWAGAAQAEVPLGTAFTYQGDLTSAGQPMNGTVKLNFKLYDAASGGNLLGSQTYPNAAVTNGIFTVRLNGAGEFGTTAFDGAKRWLEIAVNDSTLTPRQEVTAEPYALYSAGPWVTSGPTISYATGFVCVGTATPNPLAALTVSATGPSAEAIRSDAPNGIGVEGTSNLAGSAGIEGDNAITGGFGVRGSNTNSGNWGVLGTQYEGVYGTTSSGNGVTGLGGIGTGVNGSGYNGVLGTSAASDGNGVKGECDTGTNAYGVWGSSSSGWAGVFTGNAQVTGTFYASAKNFRIDHPLDPANKMLIHASIESSEMKNLYDGTATLDAAGEAWVELPAWFESLNENFRYQLTCIGDWAPVFVKQKISGNRFLIAGGKPGMEVSWQVTGVRHDAYAQAHPMQVEVAKTGTDQGRYLNPEAFGQPASMSVFSDKMTASASAAARK